MIRIRPFEAYIPDGELAARVVAPPISMVSSDQSDFPELDPLSFSGFIGGLPSSMPREEAAAWLRKMIDNKSLRSTAGASFLISEVTMDDWSAKGVVAEVALDAYDSGRIKRHEETRAETETGLANRLAAIRANGSPVALAHRPSATIHAAIAECSVGPPDLHFVARDGVTHSLWIVNDPELTHRITTAFGDLGSLYITDGHHRMAAAARLARHERADNPSHTGSEPYNFAVAALFSADQLRLRAFTRCVIGDISLSTSSLVSQLEEHFTIEPAPVADVGPSGRGEFGMVVEGQGYRLAIRNSDVPQDPYRALDVVFLQDHVLGPTFGITDPRSDERLHFVSDRVQPDDVLHEHCWAWFQPYPTTVSDVMEVADHELTMPPKSTWFEPKLPTGLVVRLLD